MYMNVHIFLVPLLIAVFSGPAIADPMVEIPAGEFIVGDSNPPQKVFLDSFLIDRHEATNGEFAIEFPRHTFPKGAEDHPVSNITWHEASEYCRLSGGRLPSSAQWEKAARGTDGRLYPWGDKVPRKRAHPFISGVVKRKAGTLRHDYSPYGLYGMSGSVWEWTADSHESKKIVRGGLWNLHLDFYFSKTFDRNFISPDKNFIFLGFRCARSER